MPGVRESSIGAPTLLFHLARIIMPSSKSWGLLREGGR